ncbi:unnamed protein product, partial [Polarella glacialis]
AVRAATQQGLASYASGGAERLVASLRLVADFGISHPSSWRVRLHSILSVQQLVGSSSGASLADVDLSWLLECLVPNLCDDTQLVVHAAKQSLSHLESVLNKSFVAGVCFPSSSCA